MIEGKEPLRTFSDLLQFVRHQDEPEQPVPAAVAGQKAKTAEQPAESPPPNAEGGDQPAGNSVQHAEIANETAAAVSDPNTAAG
jgi:hypothetical protein